MVLVSKPIKATAHCHLPFLARSVSKHPTSPEDDIRLVRAACHASCHIYKADPALAVDLDPAISSPASIAGTSKAASIWKHDRARSLIVAVRGTASAAQISRSWPGQAPPKVLICRVFFPN
jgi:hypothetical protein